MRIFALELNNDIKGVEQRKAYIEDLIRRLPQPELVVLPELALCSYMASRKIWQYADDCGKNAAAWAAAIAKKYRTHLGVGYLDRADGDYYNRYLIAGPDGVCGVVTKSEGESAVFKRGRFGSVIETPFGKVGVGICYDSRRKHFYDNVKTEPLSLILFPHGAPADPTKPDRERREIDTRCLRYANAFGVPVVYVNCKGALEFMPGKMGRMMQKRGFRMNGMSKIYAAGAAALSADVPEAVGADVSLSPQRLKQEIRFYGEDILPGNRLFRHLILQPDTKAGVASYEKHKTDAVPNT
ncbi:MAG: carbon-nitrogen hydrolase family protein [Clostridia bacterium]|nr:carbon-nitrogen hydrolase family protein [Clostridia bacterium]